MDGFVLDIFSSNEILPYKKTNRKKTGLSNIRERLIHAYGKDVEFFYSTKSHNIFELNIRIPRAKLN
jgi:LytS/YehU family sensor histidine kinase